MEKIGFIIPIYLEIRDSLSQFDLQLIAFALVALCLGYLVARVRRKILINGMREELEELRTRVQGEESLLANKKPPELREQIHVGEAGIANENASRAIISYPEMGGTDISDGPDILEEVEPVVDLREMNHKPKHRKVLVTKLIGSDNAGTRLQNPEFGLEILPPVAGKPYLVELEGGGLLRTSVVTKISDGYIQTRNSLYKVEELNGERECSQED